jgi:heme a synthase
MTALVRPQRSRPVAIWLMIVAALVVAMVMVGGATRLTDSGLSITEWKPISGVIPPLSDADWQAEFARYREIPQYQQLNLGMSMAAFKAIFWWEWSHRLLGRLLGVAFALPFAWFAFRRAIPAGLGGRLVGLFFLGGLQGAVGWWMVASGLSERVSVAPERLAIHLGLAFALLGALVWTGLDAWAGRAPPSPSSRWRAWAWGLLGLIYLQVLLGALVAGNDAGLIYNDFPLMNGRLLPDDYAGPSLWATLAHSQGAVQLHHRLAAYVLVIAAGVLGFGVWRAKDLDGSARLLAALIVASVLGQALLGIATLTARAPLGLAMAHQAAAALLLILATAFAWRTGRP